MVVGRLWTMHRVSQTPLLLSGPESLNEAPWMQREAIKAFKTRGFLGCGGTPYRPLI